VIQLSDNLSLPNDAVTQPFAFLARRGAGKSYGAMKLAEGMLDIGAQVLAIDPVGIWYSLRIAADGKGKGYDLPIFGGLHGDIPLEPGAGALIADLIVDRNISAVLDVSMFRKNERKQFATAFAEQLFHRKKQHRSPVHLFVEEAQVFVPQRTMGDEARMLGAFEDIVKLGRNFGIGVCLISQRPQSVNKDALNQTEALFVLRRSGVVVPRLRRRMRLREYWSL
jgi:DNA helicase HerA-like ATPase